jgi:curved DNA-binding protein CbpA
MRRSLYEELEVSKNASENQIRKAYRRLALIWHPDRNPHRIEEANERFSRIANAYEVLSNSQKRLLYDQHQRTGNSNGFDPSQVDPNTVFSHVFGQRSCPTPSLFWWPLIQLTLALWIDFLGVLPILLPFFGEFFDIAWAPVSAWLISRIFNDSLAATLGLFEELLPGTDIVPTATLAWLRQYLRYVPVWLGLTLDNA